MTQHKPVLTDAEIYSIFALDNEALRMDSEGDFYTKDGHHVDNFELLEIGKKIELAALAKLMPNMFWDADNPEWSVDSIHEILVNCDALVGSTAQIQRAVRLSDLTIKVTGYDEDENEYTYEVVPSE